MDEEKVKEDPEQPGESEKTIPIIWLNPETMTGRTTIALWSQGGFFRECLFCIPLDELAIKDTDRYSIVLMIKRDADNKLFRRDGLPVIHAAGRSWLQWSIPDEYILEPGCYSFHVRAVGPFCKLLKGTEYRGITYSAPRP